MEELKKGDMVMLKLGVFFPDKRTLGVIEYSSCDGYDVRVGGGVSVGFGDYYSMADTVDELVRKKQNFKL